MTELPRLLHTHIGGATAKDLGVGPSDALITVVTLGGAVAVPISIRDQIVRAEILAQQLAPAVHPHDLVAVYGAGPAGVSFALEMAEAGRKVRLVEAAEPFSRLASVSSRFVCPTQYEWPASHWHEQTFLGGELVYGAGYASGLASGWSSWFDTKVAEEKATVISTPDSPTMYLFNKADETAVPSFYVDARGPGEETTGVEDGEFASVKFWAKDDLHISSRGYKRILICGGGDGAIQDLLLSVAGAPSPYHLFGLEGSVDPLTAIAGELAPQVGALQRALGVGSSRALTTAVEDLDAMIASLLDGANGEALVEAAKERIESFFEKSDDREVWLLHRNDRPDPGCYPLNRLAFHVVSAVDHGSVKLEGHMAKVAAVESASDSHSCAGDATSCRTHPHTVTVEMSEGSDAWAGHTLEFDRVLLRFGFKKSSVLPRGPLGGIDQWLPISS